MYAGPEPWAPTAIDPGHDDYFDHGTDCLDVARSAFLDPLVADAQMPPGWTLRPRGASPSTKESANYCALPHPG